LLGLLETREDPVMIKAILAHPAGKAYSAQPRLPPGRMLPVSVLG
jgi:hypothetical protein